MGHDDEEDSEPEMAEVGWPALFGRMVDLFRKTIDL
jgi:hypothetical protein